jgi:hypothetical protein
MATEGSPVPGAIVIGELVRLREKLAWRMAAQSGAADMAVRGARESDIFVAR